MNRKQFLILVLALAVLGGAGIALFYQDIAAYRASGAKIGARLLPAELKLADVARLHLQDAKSQVTLVRKDDVWVVQERGGYPANFQQISDLMVKLLELKVTQSETVGASLLPRLDLVEPGKGEGAGTLVEFGDAKEKPLARLVLGKIVKKKDPLNPLPAAQDGVPAGRYVLLSSPKDTVVVVSDPLSAADATPGKWLSKTFFKIDRVRTLTAGPEGAAPTWKITRAEEWGQWKFATGGGNLAAGRAVAAVNALGQISFSDISLNPKPEDADKPVVVTAETFDNLTYTIRIAKLKTGEDYLVNIKVAGDPPAAREAEKGEKAEMKEKRDKEFADARSRTVERVKLEQILSRWHYVVGKREVEPLLASRADLIAVPRPKGEGPPPGFPGMPGMPGMRMQ
jgi:hypothetical protein